MHSIHGLSCGIDMDHFETKPIEFRDLNVGSKYRDEQRHFISPFDQEILHQ